MGGPMEKRRLDLTVVGEETPTPSIMIRQAPPCAPSLFSLCLVW
jgi:hypothetical protein